MKFYTTQVAQTDRYTDGRSPLTYEKITLTVRLTGSGDTRKFTTSEITSIVMDRLREIEPDNQQVS